MGSGCWARRRVNCAGGGGSGGGAGSDPVLEEVLLGAALLLPGAGGGRARDSGGAAALMPPAALLAGRLGGHGMPLCPTGAACCCCAALPGTCAVVGCTGLCAGTDAAAAGGCCGLATGAGGTAGGALRVWTCAALALPSAFCLRKASNCVTLNGGGSLQFQLDRLHRCEVQMLLSRANRVPSVTHLSATGIRQVLLALCLAHFLRDGSKSGLHSYSRDGGLPLGLYMISTAIKWLLSIQRANVSLPCPAATAEHLARLCELLSHLICHGSGNSESQKAGNWIIYILLSHSIISGQLLRLMVTTEPCNGCTSHSSDSSDGTRIRLVPCIVKY